MIWPINKAIRVEPRVIDQKQAFFALTGARRFVRDPPGSSAWALILRIFSPCSAKSCVSKSGSHCLKGHEDINNPYTPASSAFCRVPESWVGADGRCGQRN